MNLSIGIVGLPNVGKSTLFNALTEKSVPAENFPFCTIDPSVGVVGVPDQRLTKLAEFSESGKTVPAVVEFVDIAGLVRGAHEGEGLGNQFLSHIREVDAIAQVVRVFEDPDITHVHGEIRPYSDIEVINLELIMADLQTVTKRLSTIESDVKKGNTTAVFEKELLERFSATLQEGKQLLQYTGVVSTEGKKIVKRLNLLTTKPILYVLNHKGGSTPLEESAQRELFDFLESSGSLWVEVDAGVESELATVSLGDRDQFRREFGVADDGVHTLIRKGFELLDLITFFTTGEKETRGWQIPRNSSAPKAGAAIHSDFEEKFIRAEVIPWDVLLKTGSRAAAREQGLLRTVGKDYIVQDGDVIEFRI